MCAGAWRTYSFPLDLEVHYLEEDQGKTGQNTAFDLGSFACDQANLFWSKLKENQHQLAEQCWQSWSQTSWSKQITGDDSTQT